MPPAFFALRTQVRYCFLLFLSFRFVARLMRFFAAFLPLALFLSLLLEALMTRLLRLTRRFLQILVRFLISLRLIFRLNGLIVVVERADRLPAASRARNAT